MSTDAVPRRRWIKLALALSVGLNLAVLGIVGGALVKGPPEGRFDGPGLWSYAHALPEPYRGDLRRSLRDTRNDWIGPRNALKGRREALAAALVRDPFDQAEVAAILTDQARLANDLAAQGQSLLMRQITRMSAGDRAAYAEALRQDRRPKR